MLDNLGLFEWPVQGPKDPVAPLPLGVLCSPLPSAPCPQCLLEAGSLFTSMSTVCPLTLPCQCVLRVSSVE